MSSPSFSTMSVSQTVITNSIACSMRRTAIFSSSTSLRMTFRSSARAGGESPTAGSSSSSSGGSVASARTISTMRRCPPESSRAHWSATCGMPIISSSARAFRVPSLSAAFAARVPSSRPPNELGIRVWRPARTFSSAVRSPNRPPFWNVRRTPRAEISCGVRGVDRRALEEDGSPAQRLLPRDRLEQGRLSRAVGPDEGAHLARLGLEAHLVHRGEAPEPDAGAGDFEQGHVSPPGGIGPGRSGGPSREGSRGRAAGTG